MLFLLWISILAISFLYFFRESFIAELAISFLPYIIWFCVIALIIEIYLIIHESKRRRKHKWIRIFFTIIITILTIWIWTMYSSEFFWFYNKDDESIRLRENEGWTRNNPATKCNKIALFDYSLWNHYVKDLIPYIIVRERLYCFNRL